MQYSAPIEKFKYINGTAPATWFLDSQPLWRYLIWWARANYLIYTLNLQIIHRSYRSNEILIWAGSTDVFIDTMWWCSLYGHAYWESSTQSVRRVFWKEGTSHFFANNGLANAAENPGTQTLTSPNLGSLFFTKQCASHWHSKTRCRHGRMNSGTHQMHMQSSGTLGEPLQCVLPRGVQGQPKGFPWWS